MTVLVYAYRLLAFLLLVSVCNCNERVDGRYSYSLTTFDPNGRLGQVERAMIAASLGTPVLAVCRKEHILMVSPQGLPSKLVLDDGTSRFCRISPSILVAHSGVGADGRVVGAAAQRMAVEYEYTFDEDIPIENFLEEISLLFQEYTIEAGSRPFGCALLVAYFPQNIAMGGPPTPQLYRIEPSGSVESLGTHGVIGNSASLSAQLSDIAKFTNNTLEQDHSSITQMLRNHLQESVSTGPSSPTTSFPILMAAVSKDGMVMERQE